MKTRLLTFLLSAWLVFSFTSVQAQSKEPSSPASHRNDILNASPELKKHYANVFINAFKNLCVAYIAQPEQLQAQLQHAAVLPPELANMILNNNPGKAWAIENSKENGFHLIAIMDQHYYCSVQTMATDPSEVEKLFAEVVSTAPEGAEFSLLKDETTEQDNGNIIHQLSYILTNNSNTVIQFSLRINSLPQNNEPQAKISIFVDRI